MTDFRHGMRILVTQPGFAITAILALALGIGTNTAIFSFVDALLLRPLPYPNASQLVAIYENAYGNPTNSVSPAVWMDWQAQADFFDGLAAWATSEAILTDAGEPEVLRSQMVSHEFFPVLQVKPHRGRAFGPDDDRPNAAPVVILSHALWQRRFGGDESVIGSNIRLNDTAWRVVGVMPPDFFLTIREIDFWQPYSLDRTRDWRRNAGRFINVLGRIRPGVDLETAQARMAAVSARIAEAHPEFNKNTSANVVPLRDVLTDRIRNALFILLGAVGALLLISCLNVANLLLARTAARRREMAVRAALGGTRWRIIRQLLAENLVLALAGGIAGVMLAQWLVSGLLLLIPEGLVQVKDVPLDLRILSFALVVSAATSLLFGLAPAMAAVKDAPATAMHDGGRTGTRRTDSLRKVFIAGQVALTLTLLCSAGLLVRSFVKLHGVDPGLDPRDLLTMRVGLPGARYREPEQRLRFFQTALDRIRRLPGVIDVSAGASAPVTGGAGGTAVQIAGKPDLPLNAPRLARVRSVMPGYFRILKTPLHRGRDFEVADMKQGLPPVFIVNESFVRKYSPDQDPLSASISVLMQRENPYGRIVGVVADAKEGSLEKEGDPTVFYHYGRLTYPGITLLVRTANQAAVARETERIVREIDPNQPVTQVRSMEQLLAGTTARQRMNAIVLAAFSLSALLLASIGIYGVIAYMVTERTREIGVRMALGAQAVQVLRKFAAEGLRPTLAGLGAGLVMSFAVTRLLKTQLFGIEPTDPVTFALAAVLLMAVALAAVMIPARRATRIDPAIALRDE